MHHILLYLSLLFVFGLSTADWLGADTQTALKSGVASVDVIDVLAEEASSDDLDDLRDIAVPVRCRYPVAALTPFTSPDTAPAQVSESPTPGIPIRAPPGQLA